MCNLHLLAILILMVLEWSLVNSQGCSTPGWFGPNCEFKCHCENDICDSANGQCTGNTKCMRGWFGVGCQYQDLTSVPSATITSYPLQASNTWITDRDDSTFNQDIYLQSVVVAWNITYPFSWLRPAVKDNAYPGQFMVSFKTSGGSLTETPCNSQHFYEIDTNTVDISCQMTVDVMQVIIRGQSVRSLCSLYISGGRNIALKQNATQSSTYTLEGLSLSQASNAVDCNTSGNIRINTCTHTAGVGDSPPSWSVTFRENHTVNRIVLYNRFDSADIPCCPERLIHFGLQTFNASYNPVFSYRDTGDTAMLIYTVIVPDAQRHMFINGIRVDSNIQVLTLCEVQAFEECAPGTWGLECKNKCTPSCDTSCDVETGVCQSCIGFSNPPTCHKGCELNHWGINCNQSCSTQCYAQS